MGDLSFNTHTHTHTLIDLYGLRYWLLTQQYVNQTAEEECSLVRP